jgi:type IV pilus assembly protein PilB
LTCIRNLFALDPERQDLPQKGRAHLDIEGRDYDLLVHALPTSLGTSITIKLVDRRFFLKNFTALGLTPPEQLFLVQALDASAGLIMVTSPPYNGAMTSSYSLMDHVAKSARKVVSIERSIQWEVPYVHQMEVNPDKGLDFASALRSVAAGKPDVVFLLELSDEATANLACQLATSVLVITTFPAFGAAESVHRFLELGVPASLLSRSLTFVMNQRLVRRICPKCRETFEPPRPMRRVLEKLELDVSKLFKGVGCRRCRNSGFSGRIGLHELLIVDDELRDAIVADAAIMQIRKMAIASGMITMQDDGLGKVREGITTVEEVLHVAGQHDMLAVEEEKAATQ